MNKDEKLDALLSAGLGTISLREIVERAYDMGAISIGAKPETNHGKLKATRDNELLQKVLNKIKEVKEERITAEMAVTALTTYLKSDADYRNSWRANLSLCFYDTYFEFLPKSKHEVHNKAIKEVCDAAAEKFLSLFCNE